MRHSSPVSLCALIVADGKAETCAAGNKQRISCSCGFQEAIGQFATHSTPSDFKTSCTFGDVCGTVHCLPHDCAPAAVGTVQHTLIYHTHKHNSNKAGGS
jgi:hypothetical protein